MNQSRQSATKSPKLRRTNSFCHGCFSECFDFWITFPEEAKYTICTSTLIEKDNTCNNFALSLQLLRTWLNRWKTPHKAFSCCLLRDSCWRGICPRSRCAQTFISSKACWMLVSIFLSSNFDTFCFSACSRDTLTPQQKIFWRCYDNLVSNLKNNCKRL